MLGKRIHLFKLFGFDVRMHISSFFLAAFITWSLATNIFPEWYAGFSSITYWGMGIAGAFGLFASIIFHEFCHSIVARRYGLEMKGITLFIFGGVAEMGSEPPNAKSEFMMAIAGPVSSGLLAVILYFIHTTKEPVREAGPVSCVLHYLMFLNIILAGFNLLPGFPLDGGRILRSILWGIKKDLEWATKIASRLGSGFGILLITLGIIIALTGDLLGGVWLFLIGSFLRGASRASYKQLLLRNRLHGRKIRNFMKSRPVTVPSDISIEQLVQDYFYRYHFKMFPVIEDGQLFGCITAEQIKQTPRDRWSSRSVGEFARPPSYQNTIDPEADALEAFSIMNRTGKHWLMVVENGQLAGIVTLNDMLKFFSLKMNLEG